MNFSKKLRELKTKANLSERELAERSGVAPSTVHTYLLGIREPSLANAAKLAAALGVDCRAFTEDVAAKPAPKKGKGKK